VTSRLRPAEAPVREDDAFLEAALAHASIPTLMMSIVHLTGDSSLLRGDVRPARAVMGETQGGMSTADKARVRDLALGALRAHRDRGGSLPPPPSPETLHEMMSFMVGEPVPREYVPMMLEELALDGEDARDVGFEAISDAAKASLPVLVVGAGMSGILAAIRLEEAGIPYQVIEKNDAVGGTWLENRYPGCRVDVANHFYCYSFEPSHAWPEYFSQRRELQTYFEGCTDRHGIRPRIRFGAEAVEARWDEAARRWRVRLRTKDGREETLSAAVLVSAVGQLNRPRLPEIAGRDRFEGASFHSARWNPDVPLAGQRVAVIGSGASALQLVPEVAKQAGTLYVYQRSPAWMLPNPRYHRRVSAGAQWLLEHVPYYARWYRFLLFWPGSDGLLPSLVVDPDWPHPERSVSAANDRLRQAFVAYLRSQVGGDPELLAKVVPSYPPFGKRMLQDDGSWFAALKRENVELVTEPIERITPRGIVTADGRERELDVIVHATGFQANRFLWPLKIFGRSGHELTALWGDDPRAYLGVTVPDHPNFFCLYGPGTNLAHAGSIIFHSECQVRYLMGCLEGMLEHGWRVLDCKPEVLEAYDRRYQETMSRMVWSHPGMGSWYKNAKGRVTTTSPWRLRDYWEWTREPDFSDYHVRA